MIINIMESFSDIASQIWADFKRRKKTDNVFKQLSIDKQLEYYQKTYKAFHQVYPIVLRYMIQANSFSKKGFNTLNKSETKREMPKGNELETLKEEFKRLNNELKVSEIIWCRKRARYVKQLHMENSRSHNTKEAQKVWKKTYNMLIDEIKIIKKAEEEIDKRNKKNKKINSEQRREELRKLLGSSNVV